MNSMKSFDLKKFIAEQSLDRKAVASILFPSNAYPVMALARVEKKKGFLNTQQLEKLSEFSGVPVCDMFTPGAWKSSVKGSAWVFKKGSYEAILNLEDMSTQIFHVGAMRLNLGVFTLISGKSILLCEYIKDLEKLLTDLKNEQLQS